MKKIMTLLAVSSLFSSTSFAMFCPNGFNSINIGDTSDQVQAQCGKPDSIKSHESKKNLPQEWNYYVNMVKGQQGSIKMVIAFKDNKVINMSVNGVGLTNTSICGGVPITLNQTQEQIKKACGDPVYVNESKGGESSAAKPDIVSEYLYNSNPPITLIFMNGKLTGRR